MTIAHTRVYVHGHLEAEGFPIEDVSDHLVREGTVVWVDLCEPTPGELQRLSEEFGLHELAVEDALTVHQRPKLDRYETHLFLSTYAVRVSIEDGELVETGIDAFVNSRWIVTVRKNPIFDIDDVVRRFDRSPDLARYGVSYLLYGLLDVIVDGYFAAVQQFDDYYDDVSDGIFAENPLEPSQQRHWFEMRKAMVRFHRLAVPMREAVSSLMRREHSAVADELYPYYQDVYDHILRVSESTEALRDLVATIVETNISLRDYRQNQVMKKVTSWAAIIAVPTLITGFYGMNVPYTGYGETSGVIAASALIVLCSAGLFAIFRRRDWL